TMGSVELAAEKSNVVYSPLLPFGHSPHHMGEAGWGTGSISLPANVYRDVLYSIGRSLIFAGFNKLVFVSHHGTKKLWCTPLSRQKSGNYLLGSRAE
ncbi:MAG TPA: creatininase family protein, partial [Chloroflexota bacterium]|nr:creatininase family protein [Chloroflexota bacterium]